MGFFDGFKKSKDSEFVNIPMPPPPPNPVSTGGEEQVMPEQMSPGMDETFAPPASDIPLSEMPPKKESSDELFQIAPLEEKQERFQSFGFEEIPMPKPDMQRENYYTEQLEPLEQKENIPDSLPSLSLYREQVNTMHDDAMIPYFEDSVETDNLPIMDTENTAPYTNFKYREIKKPLFIRSDSYSQILSDIDTIQNYVNSSSNFIYSMENLKKNADMEHKYYKKVLEDIQRKLIYVDRALFEQKEV